MDKIKSKLSKSVDLSKSTELIGYLIKTTQLTSVDFTFIYHEKINTKRYLMSILHFVMNCLGVIIAFIVIYPLYHLIENEYFPKNCQKLLLFGLIDMIMSISMRMDMLFDEWKNKLSVLKFCYYIQNNIKSKHQLNKSNNRKLGIDLKFLEIVLIKGLTVIMVGSVTLNTLYIAFRCDKITFKILSPLIIYWIWCVSFAISIITPVISFTTYYYKLRFDQLNNRFEKICKTKDSISINDLKRLILLIRQHDLLSIQIHKTNLWIRRSVGLFFVCVALLQILPLHLIMGTNVLFEQLFYSQYIITAFLFGKAPALLFSIQIESAHKPRKVIYKILTQNISFRCKWKVFIFKLP